MTDTGVPPHVKAARPLGNCLAGKPGIRGFHGFLAALTLVAILLSSAEYGAAEASMFICRDQWGAVSFTNVPNSSDCSPFSFKENQRKQFEPATSGGGGSSKFDRDIRKVARRYDVDPSLIKAIIHTESDFDHQAVSTKGAQGLMQLMPGTARDLRVDNPFNPRENIDGGTRYFRQLMDSFNGNLILSLAAYNAGPGLVMRTGGVPSIPETRKYVHKVLKRYKQYKAGW